MRGRTRGAGDRLAVAQGLYYTVTGLWPLLSMGTFKAVTGPKQDRWLVRTVAVLVTVVGAATGLAGLRRRRTPEIALMAGGSAAGLGAIDAWYGGRGRISRLYLLDAAAEAALVGAWLRWWPRTDRR